MIIIRQRFYYYYYYDLEKVKKKKGVEKEVEEDNNKYCCHVCVKQVKSSRIFSSLITCDNTPEDKNNNNNMGHKQYLKVGQSAKNRLFGVAAPSSKKQRKMDDGGTPINMLISEQSKISTGKTNEFLFYKKFKFTREIIT